MRVPVGFQASVRILSRPSNRQSCPSPSVCVETWAVRREDERVRTRPARNGILVILCLQVAEYIAKAIFVYEPAVGLL